MAYSQFFVAALKPETREVAGYYNGDTKKLTDHECHKTFVTAKQLSKVCIRIMNQGFIPCVIYYKQECELKIDSFKEN